MKSKTTICTAILLAFAALLAGCGQNETAFAGDLDDPVDREYELVGFMHGYYGVGGEIDGVKNPVLTARAGETVRINLINGERMPHDVALKQHKVRSREILQKGERTTLVFTAEQDDTYYCTIPGHVQTGMIGTFELIESEQIVSEIAQVVR